MTKKIFFLLALIQLHFVLAITDTAILVVDMQEGFIHNQRSYVARKLIEMQLHLLEWGREEGFSVLVFEYDFKGDTIEIISDSVKEFKQYAYVTKYLDGGFDNFPMNRHSVAMLLRSWGIKNVIISGINGPYCVYDTIEGALKNNFNVFISPEIVANLAPGEHKYPDCSWNGIDHQNLYIYKTFKKLADDLSF